MGLAIDRRDDAMKKFWPFSFYFLYFAAIAFMMPFLVLYFQELGFSGAQIGMLTGITPLITFVSVPIWTGFADASSRHRVLMSIAMLVSIAGVAALPFAKTFVLVFVLGLLINVFFAPVTAFADSATMFMLADKKELYGRIRLGGTIGFGIMASFSGALVQNMGLKVAFWGAAILLFLGLIVSQQLAHDPAKTDRSTGGSARLLLANPRWLLFLTIGFGGGFALSAANTYFYPYMRELGASESIMGLSLTLGTIVEIPVLLFVNKLLRRFGSYSTLMISMVISATRLLLLAAVGKPELALLIQMLNGFTFPVMWVAGVSYVAENAPAGLRTSAQGLFSAIVMGIGAAVGGFSGGLLLENIGGRGLYLVFGVIVFIILAIVTLLWSRLPVESQTEPATAL